MKDGFRSYQNLSRHNGYNLFVVNHSVNFFDPIDRSVHTQNVEKQWKHLKAWLKKKGSNLGHSIGDYLFEYCFKRKSDNAFSGILGLLSFRQIK